MGFNLIFSRLLNLCAVKLIYETSFTHLHTEERIIVLFVTASDNGELIQVEF